MATPLRMFVLVSLLPLVVGTNVREKQENHNFDRTLLSKKDTNPAGPSISPVQRPLGTETPTYGPLPPSTLAPVVRECNRLNYKPKYSNITTCGDYSLEYGYISNEYAFYYSKSSTAHFCAQKFRGTKEQCRALCMSYEACLAFSWHPLSRKCWLKSLVPDVDDFDKRCCSRCSSCSNPDGWITVVPCKPTQSPTDQPTTTQSAAPTAAEVTTVNPTSEVPITSPAGQDATFSPTPLLPFCEQAVIGEAARGSAAVTGQVELTTRSGGLGFARTNDSFFFVHKPWTLEPKGVLQTKVKSISGPKFGHACIMARKDLTPESPHVSLCLIKGSVYNKVRFLYRKTAGDMGETTSFLPVPNTHAVTLRITTIPSTATGFVQFNGSVLVEGEAEYSSTGTVHAELSSGKFGLASTSLDPLLPDSVAVFQDSFCGLTLAPMTNGPTVVPSTGSPTFSPLTSNPVSQSPSTAFPSSESPLSDSPVTFNPASRSPTKSGPTTTHPSTQSPLTVSPFSRHPTTIHPTMVRLTSESPVTAHPVTLSPATSVPTTTHPFTLQPTTQNPTAETPFSRSPTSQSPITPSPQTESPSSKIPTSAGQITSSPISESPATAHPLTSSPATAFPTTTHPLTQHPFTQSPLTTSPSSPSPNTGSPVTNSPVTSVPTTTHPLTAHPFTRTPVTGSPLSRNPTTVTPATTSPSFHSQNTTNPATLSPVTLVPTTRHPLTPHPVTQNPASVEPTSRSPTTRDPVTASPSSDNPVTINPVTLSPVTPAPTTTHPLTSHPFTQNPATVSPSSRQPTTAGPATESPLSGSPNTAHPVTSRPITSVPTTIHPLTPHPFTHNPVTVYPTSKSPTTASPITTSPASESPNTAHPVTQSPVTSIPTTMHPFTLHTFTLSPLTRSPSSQSPNTAHPATPNPGASAPTSTHPSTSHPFTQSPVTLGPSSRHPTTANPTTAGPTPESSNTTHPVTLSPVTSAPTTRHPLTPHPLTQSPATAGPLSKSPSTANPTTAGPSSDSPVTTNPVTQSPVTSTPSTTNRLTAHPFTQNPITENPLSESPATIGPATRNPVTFTPTTHPSTETPSSANPPSDSPTEQSMNPVTANPRTLSPSLSSTNPTTLSPATSNPTTLAPSIDILECGGVAIGPDTTGSVTSLENGVVETRVSSSGLINASDSFLFVSSDRVWATGDPDSVNATVSNLTGLPISKACVMIRGSFDPSSAHASLCLLQGGLLRSVQMVVRMSFGAQTSTGGSILIPEQAPVQLRLVESNSGSFSGYFRVLDQAVGPWTFVGSRDAAITTGFFGYALSSGNVQFESNATLRGDLCGPVRATTAPTITGVTLSPSQSPTRTPPDSGCNSTAIGPTASGSVDSLLNGRLRVLAGGTGLSDISDDFFYVFNNERWDESQVEIRNVSVINKAALVGSHTCVMVRRSLAPNAAHISVCFVFGDPVGSVVLVSRESDGGVASSFGFVEALPPVHLRIDVTNGVFSGMARNDTSDEWMLVAAVSNPSLSSGFVGYAVASYDHVQTSVLLAGALCLPVVTLSPTFEPTFSPFTVSPTGKPTTTVAPTPLPLCNPNITVTTTQWIGGWWIVRNPEARNSTRYAPLVAAPNFTFTSGFENPPNTSVTRRVTLPPHTYTSPERKCTVSPTSMPTTVLGR